MTIKDITIINFGSIRFFQTSLDSRIAVIETRYSSELSAAIEVVLCNKTVSSLPVEWVRSDTSIQATVCLDNAIYHILAKSDTIAPFKLIIQATDEGGRKRTKLYHTMLSHCLEQDAIESFDGCDKSIPLRLCWYRNAEDYVPPGSLEVNSEHIATTKTFRAKLIKYIRAFEPEPINNRKQYKVAMRQDGKFKVFYPGIKEDVCLSMTEEKLFLYVCFLNITEFWSDIESLRNIHHIKKPLLIKDFLEHLDESVEIEHLIKRTLLLKRQVIIVALPIKKEILNKWIGEKL